MEVSGQTDAPAALHPRKESPVSSEQNAVSIYSIHTGVWLFVTSDLPLILNVSAHRVFGHPVSFCPFLRPTVM